jgi:FtsP/CotA-like multicopper oxidase with cupredoxin domain
MKIDRRQFLKRSGTLAGTSLAMGALLEKRALAQDTQHQHQHPPANPDGSTLPGMTPPDEMPAVPPSAPEAAPPAHAELYAGGEGSMMFHRGHNMMGTRTEPPGAPPDSEVHYRTIKLSFEVTEHELLPGVRFHAFTFNGQIPGPEIRVKEGDWVKVEALNNTEEMHTIHWHGVDVPYTMDGVPMATQDPIHPGQTFVYRFQAKPAGTRFYHCHWGTPLHMSSALHGAFIVEAIDDPIRRAFPYEREYVLVLESWDVDFTRRELNSILSGMKQVNKQMASGKLDPRTHGFFRNYESFVRAVESGDYVPPYVRGAAPFRRWEPNFFGINGKCWPAADPRSLLHIRSGEWIRVRIVNGGMGLHHMHLHGHQFVHVAEDGNALHNPPRLNTISVFPGKTVDIMIHGDNPGFWSFHDHMSFHASNNGIYPGGMMTHLVYDDLENPPYVPSLSIIQ